MEQNRLVQLLGGFSCPLRDGERLPTRRAQLLLARLALRPGKAFSRDALGEMLWPDGDPERQRANLRVELLFLRRALGDEVIQAEGKQFIRLGSGWSSDVSRFEAAALAAVRAESPPLRCEPLQLAAASYTGELLPGYYDDWILLERARLHELFHDILHRLIRDLEQVGSTEEARQGRTVFAQHFPERSAPALPTTPGGFIGRERELMQVRQWLATPQKRVLTLTGPPGIGKSRLAQEALRGKSIPFLALAELATVSEDTTLAFLDAVSPEAASLLEAALQRNPRLRLLLTAPHSLDISGEIPLPLAPLTPPESLRLLQQRLPTASVAEALALLAGNPRALELALAVMQSTK